MSGESWAGGVVLILVGVAVIARTVNKSLIKAVHRGVG